MWSGNFYVNSILESVSAFASRLRFDHHPVPVLVACAKAPKTQIDRAVWESRYTFSIPARLHEEKRRKTKINYISMACVLLRHSTVT
jgi:hypothetical protein